MNNESAYIKPTFENCKALFTQSVSERVKQINDFTFEHFAKKSIIKYGFFPVLRIIESENIYIKLYYYPDRIQTSKRKIEDFSSEFYRSEIKGLSYSSCNIMSIHLETKVTAETVNSCKSMDEMELIFINTLTNDSYVGIELGNPNQGGLTLYRTFSSSYHEWKKLLDEGYLEPDYKAKCRIELERKKLETKRKKEISAGEKFFQELKNLPYNEDKIGQGFVIHLPQPKYKCKSK